MQPELPSEFFANNRMHLLERLPKGAVALVAGNNQLQRNCDVPYAFRQDSNFRYLSGINDADCLLVLSSSNETLITPNAQAFRQLWNGQSPKAELLKLSGIDKILEKKQATRHLSTIIKNASYVYVLYPTDKKYINFKINPARQELMTWLKMKFPHKKIRDLRPMLTALRMVKQTEEVACISRAIKVTGEAIQAASVMLKPGKTEYELSARIKYEFHKNHMAEAFENVVAAGANACTIHYEGDNALAQKGELILFDVGAEFEGYAADISRTRPVTRFTPRQREIFAAVQAVQAEAMKLLRPGVQIRDYEQEVENIMGEKLKALGLIKKLTRENIRRYYPHATSHHLGLDVHDVADYSRPIEPNMVLTVEPGIYIPEEGIGVRIEDDVLITRNGVKNLSQAIPS